MAILNNSKNIIILQVMLKQQTKEHLSGYDNNSSLFVKQSQTQTI